MSIIKIVNERVALFAARGLTGAEIFRQLQADADMPLLLCEIEVAHLLGLSQAALRQRRARRMPPEFVSVSSRCVRYLRPAVFGWLAERAERNGRAE